MKESSGTNLEGVRLSRPTCRRGKKHGVSQAVWGAGGRVLLASSLTAGDDLCPALCFDLVRGDGRFQVSLPGGVASPGESLPIENVCHLPTPLLIQSLLWSFKGLRGKPGNGAIVD